MSNHRQADYIIIGGGIVGLCIAYAIKQREAGASIIVLEKEATLAAHGSGRNSGVLHAGFYYSADSLKARFCREGNARWKDYVHTHGLKINPCKKVVVATNEAEIEGIHELKRRGDANGVDVSIIDTHELREIDPNARSLEKALYSPSTATVDPTQVTCHLASLLRDEGVEILLGHSYQSRLGQNSIKAGDTSFEAGKIINCAGLYADKVAQDFGFGEAYTIIPFKGIHVLASRPPVPSVRTLIYPVPNLKNPFLGVHFNITVDGNIKIGPTAIPAFWRENYKGLERFSAKEMAAILGWEARLFATNAFDFRRLAIEEMRKYQRTHLLNLVRPMVQRLDDAAFTIWAKPGIRAQLLNRNTLKLEQDFIVEGDKSSVHILNAVSPGFTSSPAFAEWVVENHV